MCKMRSGYYSVYFEQWLVKYAMPALLLPHVDTMRVSVRGQTTTRCTWCGARRP